MAESHPDFFKSKVLGQPSGLFVLFFTEMWERFSFYGMRVLLINFLTMAVIGANPGWQWSMENAGALFGTYAMLLYITPIAGGIFADKIAGYRLSVAIGAAIMALGHISMAFETQTSLYLGLGLLVIGTGFFKPNITSIISEMYKDLPEKKDGAYTIFYMGVNAGAFFGMMLCGYLAERVGWSFGFGLASIFMILGTLQFWWAKPLFGKLGNRPEKTKPVEVTSNKKGDEEAEKENPFTLIDKIFIAISTIIGVGYAINDPLSKIAGIDLFKMLETSNMEGQYVGVLIGLAAFLFVVISRITRYTKIIRDRMIALIIFLFFTIFFWMSFEQGASSLIIFARDNVNRVLTGNSAIIYNIVNLLLTVVPLAIITYVLFKLFMASHKKALKSNLVLILTFAIIWGVVFWMLHRDWSSTAYNVVYNAVEVPAENTENEATTYVPITENFAIPEGAKIVEKHIKISDVEKLQEGQEINIITKNNEKTEFSNLTPEKLEVARKRGLEYNTDNGIIPAKVISIQSNQVEITTSWFSILNSFFIIALASLFSKWWDSKYNPTASVKYGLGLIIMAVGFGLLAIGAHGVTAGVKVSMIWLIFAYLFHTMGELCLSPVGLSYVSKLVPARMIAFMFGMFYLSIAIGNKIAAVLGGQIENITHQYSLSTFFLIFTIVPITAGIIVIALNPLMKKLMHGVK